MAGLASKYRPCGFDEVVGNEVVVNALRGLLQRHDRPHVYLFIGPTGCGKTTLGRILAKELGVVGADFREINTADYRGIDSVREMRHEAMFKPMFGNVSVWLLDECHRLTVDSQNALLKLFEDTPSYVYYILSTTDPQRLIAPLRGRCQTFEVKPLLEKQLISLLRRICKSEGVSPGAVGMDVFQSIVENSEGRPRDGIVLLERVLAVFPDLEAMLEIASNGGVDDVQVIALCRALLKGAPWKEVRTVLSGLYGKDVEGVRRVVLGYFSRVLLSGRGSERVGIIMEQFSEPFYDSGFPGLVLACFSIVYG